MLGCTYPGGRKIACTYDALDRKQTISDETDAANILTIASYSYIGRNRVTQQDYGNNTRMTYAYDGIFNRPDDFGVRQVIGTTHTRIDPATGALLEILDDRTYTWDRMFNKTRREDVRPGRPRLRHDYTYDPAYRLTCSVASFEPRRMGHPTHRLIARQRHGLDPSFIRRWDGSVDGSNDPSYEL